MTVNSIQDVYKRQETPLECVTREIEEETGFIAGKMTHLMTVITAIGFCDEKIPIYVATDLKLSKQHLDEDEFIDVEEYTIDAVSYTHLLGKQLIREQKNLSRKYENLKKGESTQKANIQKQRLKVQTVSYTHLV